MFRYYLLILVMLLAIKSNAQKQAKNLPAQRTAATIKLDGNIDETAWKEAIPATGFVEFRPSANKPEAFSNRTLVYILYDNTAVYVGGYCYENSRDSVSRELVGRDVLGVNDFVGVIFDTYNDKINGAGFYVTPYGEHMMQNIPTLQRRVKMKVGMQYGTALHNCITMAGASKCAFPTPLYVFQKKKYKHGVCK